jgi:hypothetical protein
MSTNGLIIKNNEELNYAVLYKSKDPYVKGLPLKRTHKEEPLLIKGFAVHFWVDLYGSRRTGLSGFLRRVYEFVFYRTL